MSDVLGIITLLASMGVVALVVSLSRLPRAVKLLVYAALALRIVGSVGRYYMVTGLYGRGDSLTYFEHGIRYAERFWLFDFSPLWDTEQWERSNWLGTQFLTHVSGVVHALIGPSLFGGFLAFSLFAFLGLVGFGVAFRRAYPDAPVGNYLRWAWLFPSVWFWPSSIGKEAVMMMGLGLAMWAFVGRNGRVNWLLLVVGLFFVFAIRPQVAAVVLFSLIVAHWFGLVRERWTLGTTVQAALLFGAGLAGIWLAMDKIGVGGFDAEGVQSYMEGSKGRDVGGGSATDNVQVGLAGIPLALVNILFRPFVWEAQSVAMLISAIEILGFWAIVWYRRHALLASLRQWRHDRLLCAALSFVLMYSVTLGMVISNLGIIARQRIFLFPFLFLLIEAVPRAASVQRCVSGTPSRAASGQRLRRPHMQATS